MRRLLSYLTSRRRGRTPVAIPAAPAADFSWLLSPTVSCPHWAGALPQFRPSPLFGGEPR